MGLIYECWSTTPKVRLIPGIRFHPALWYYVPYGEGDPDLQVDPMDGSITEMVIWQLQEPVPGCQHPFKYRLFYGFPGRSLVRYDNETGKGDHRHVEGREDAYTFTDERRLVEDFLADRRRVGGK